MWFQNRRAKFRRNERSCTLQQNSTQTTTTTTTGKNVCKPNQNAIALKSDCEKPLFPYQNPTLPTSSAADIQYVMPWKCSYSQYNQHDIYPNNINGSLGGQTCNFLTSTPFNYCTSNASVCTRLDMSSLRYRHQDFSL